MSQGASHDSQAAKYFTFIFFGLSVFVILLFGGFVICHCYRRLRYGLSPPAQPESQVSKHLCMSPSHVPPRDDEYMLFWSRQQGFQRGCQRRFAVALLMQG
jgi:hypothetical protein